MIYLRERNLKLKLYTIYLLIPPNTVLLSFTAHFPIIYCSFSFFNVL